MNNLIPSTIFVLGRQPMIGTAELERRLGTDHIKSFRQEVVISDLPESEIAFKELGGSTRMGLFLSEVRSTDWKQVEKELISLMRSKDFTLPDNGKFHLGVSVLGLNISPAKINALALTLKKVLKSRAAGSIRTVPNTDPLLSSAQVYHNHLADAQGAELLVIAGDNNSVIIARTCAVQDIDSYTMRDRGRPKRDARVGMLPPKLAQIIINLAVGQDRNVNKTPLILDPFCGTGVVLQEAMLMGYNIYGTDVEPRMITYSTENTKWLQSKFPTTTDTEITIEEGDATNHQWNKDNNMYVACETYLGRPFTSLPDHETLEQTISDTNTIIKKFLENIAPQLQPNTVLCLAVPAWQTRPHVFRRLPLVSQLKNLGFSSVSLLHVKEDLVYYRDNQIVARHLLVIKKN